MVGAPCKAAGSTSQCPTAGKRTPAHDSYSQSFEESSTVVPSPRMGGKMHVQPLPCHRGGTVAEAMQDSSVTSSFASLLNDAKESSSHSKNLPSRVMAPDFAFGVPVVRDGSSGKPTWAYTDSDEVGEDSSHMSGKKPQSSRGNRGARTPCSVDERGGGRRMGMPSQRSEDGVGSLIGGSGDNVFPCTKITSSAEEGHRKFTHGGIGKARAGVRERGGDSDSHVYGLPTAPGGETVASCMMQDVTESPKQEGAQRGQKGNMRNCLNTNNGGHLKTPTYPTEQVTDSSVARCLKHVTYDSETVDQMDFMKLRSRGDVVALLTRSGLSHGEAEKIVYSSRYLSKLSQASRAHDSSGMVSLDDVVRDYSATLRAGKQSKLQKLNDWAQIISFLRGDV